MNRRKVTRYAFAFAFALFALAAINANAQEQLPVLNSCIDASIEDSAAAPNLTITNNCGVRIHASWGFYDETSDSGIMQYSQDMFPGQTETMPYYDGVAMVVGCQFTPTPGHPYGYKLTYRSNLGKTVVSWSDGGSLVCAQW